MLNISQTWAWPGPRGTYTETRFFPACELSSLVSSTGPTRPGPARGMFPSLARSTGRGLAGEVPRFLSDQPANHRFPYHFLPTKLPLR